jgi:A/G-specific adenine glycosylase
MTDRRISKRDLPWRKTRNPYRIFVSELMLQQTQVDRVIDFYKRWLKKFPTWTSLAHATTPELLHAWAGLGYNRRALMLREAARQVVAHGVPDTVDAWQQLKGVGPYTAAAVHAITARKRLIVIDTNVRRVAGRLFLGTPYPGLSDDPKVAKALNHALPVRDAYWEFPQMLMDFGTAVCTPKDPSCATCPLREVCKTAPKFLRGTAGKKLRVVSREHKHRDKPHPDRIYRGRILAAVREGRVRSIHALGVVVDASFDRTRDDAWLRAMVARLVRDGMIAQHGAQLSLPKK